MTAPIQSRVLSAGSANAPTLALSEPVSFWGGYDPATGCIIDHHHPQSGTCLCGHIILLPGARGSGGTPACIAEALRHGVGPAGVIVAVADINIATGAQVAKTLYGTDCPVVCVTRADYDTLCTARDLAIAEDGTITLMQSGD